MTEKNIFAFKIFLSLNISDFNLFFMWQLQPPWKRSPPFSQQPPSKSWRPVKPPLFENLVGGSTHPSCRKRGCTLWLYGPFSWMGFNYLKAKEPLRGGTLLFITKLTSILSFPKNLLPTIYNSHVHVANKFWCDDFKNMKNTHGGVLLLVKMLAFSLQLY